MTLLSGSCLCGAAAYEIEGDAGRLWVCHCSLCRKVSGASSIAVFNVSARQFRWTKGADHRDTFRLRETYVVDRCRICGTPLPSAVEDGSMAVPAGTLDSPLGAGIRTHQFCGSRADWEADAPDVRVFDAQPDQF